MSAKKKLKKPKIKNGKHVKAELKNKKSPSTEYPAFSFRLCCKNNYSVKHCTPQDKEDLLNRIVVLSELKWNQIYSTGRHSFGTEKIGQSAVNPQLPAELSEDVSLLALRYARGNKAMVGYRENNIFNVLFIDHDYSVYNHG